MKLRRNGVVEELVDAFQRARGPALNFARESQKVSSKMGRRGSKRKLEETDFRDDEERGSSSARKTRSQSRKEVGPSAPEEIANTDDDSDHEPLPDDGLVSCPMCGLRMKEEKMWPHLDHCNEDDAGLNHSLKSPSTSRSPNSLNPTINKHLPHPQQTMQNRLPQLNYSLYKENAMRKKLSELGIRASGPKSLLERRHTEWVNLWNANCDSNRPRSKRELLHELDIWERSQGGLAPGASYVGGIGGGGGVSGNAVMKKDFDGAGWAATHNSEFKDLIARARQRKILETAKDGNGRSGSQSDAESSLHGKPSGVNGDVPAAPVVDLVSYDYTLDDRSQSTTPNGAPIQGSTVQPDLSNTKSTARITPQPSPSSPQISDECSRPKSPPKKPPLTDIDKGPTIDEDRKAQKAEGS
ncbi:MAG: E3 ubiquitin-protein ligase rad18 [Sclerophora amabilis]|nr:MAG: E3 ubiquitin-protein ligase rad18 [Sclerophora amabilis]